MRIGFGFEGLLRGEGTLSWPDSSVHRNRIKCKDLKILSVHSSRGIGFFGDVQHRKCRREKGIRANKSRSPCDQHREVQALHDGGCGGVRGLGLWLQGLGAEGFLEADTRQSLAATNTL